MSANTKIEWCDHTFNPWTGCTKVSNGPVGGCALCYAEGWSKRAGPKVGKWGPGAPRVRTTAANWKQPLKWNANAEAFQAEHGRRQRVFCASLADVFDNEVDPQWRADLFELIESTPNLDWLLLTKRIGNVPAMLTDALLLMRDLETARGQQWPWPNVWLGASMPNRGDMLRDAPKLLAIPAKVHFWSAEPLLEDLGDIPPAMLPEWVIAGGESGPGARPSHPNWYRSLRDQCATAGVPFLFKQWGEYSDFEHIGNAWNTLPNSTRTNQMFLQGKAMVRIGKKSAGRLLDGIEHNGFPS